MRKNSKTRMAFLSAVLSLSAAPLLCQNAIASEDAAGASAAVIVNASPKAVWRAVHEERFHDPDISFVRVLQQTSNRMTLEEVFQSVPILGSVTAVLEQREVPYGRIDYSLIRSDKFKSMSGSWCLTPVGDGHQTLLKLTSFIDLGIPFSSVFLHGAAQQKLNRRLAHVKEMAEQMHIAASAEEAL